MLCGRDSQLVEKRGSYTVIIMDHGSVFQSCDWKSNMSELPVITQVFVFLRPRVSVKASSTFSLLNIAENSYRGVLTIIFYEAIDRGTVSLLGLFV